MPGDRRPPACLPGREGLRKSVTRISLPGQGIAGRQPGRAGADDGHLLRPWSTGNRTGASSPFALAQSMTNRFSPRMEIGSPISPARQTVSQARLQTRPQTEGSGLSLRMTSIGLLELLLGDEGDVSRSLLADRADVLAGRGDDLLADHGRASLLDHVLFILGPEIPQGGKHGVGRRLPEPAERGVLDRAGQLLRGRSRSSMAAFPSRDPLDDLPHPLRPFPAGNALAAGLVAEEIQEILGDIDHAGLLVHDDHAARAHDRAGLGQALVIDGQVEHLLGQAAARRAAGLDGLERLVRRGCRRRCRR